MGGKAQDASDYGEQLKKAKEDVKAKASEVRTRYCAYLKSRREEFPKEIAKLKPAFDKGQTKFKNKLMRNMDSSYACFCSGNGPLKFGKCRWEFEYGWDATSFIVHGKAKTTCEAGTIAPTRHVPLHCCSIVVTTSLRHYSGWWFGVYAKEDRQLGPTGLTQVGCALKANMATTVVVHFPVCFVCMLSRHICGVPVHAARLFENPGRQTGLGLLPWLPRGRDGAAEHELVRLRRRRKTSPKLQPD